ncbi:MAG: BrnA antitoxin family protein [Paludibaculum sp.]
MKKLTLRQKAELEALVSQPHDQIDTKDIPEVKFTGQAVVGKFYRPIKKPVSVRLDADVLDWLKRSGPGYQRRINLILRLEMQRSVEK